MVIADERVAFITSNLGYKRVDREGHGAAAIVHNGALRYMAAGYLSLSLALRRDALDLHTKQQRQHQQ
uniref:Glutamine amidotransferase type-2 domain-containing protein n=1 Tax=Trichogramma kaykai TaxID=54128 RepID=A0ABD2X5D2_9HYME